MIRQVKYYSSNPKFTHLHSFENVHTKIYDVAFKTATKNISGIYVWENGVNGKLYVGSAVNMRPRVLDYMQPWYKSDKKNDPILRAINKYGIESFILHIVEYTDYSKSAIITAEQNGIERLKPEYNQLMIAGSSQGYKHTPEARALISQRMLGKPRSAEVRIQISIRQTGSNNTFYGIKHTPEAVELLRQSALKRTTSNKPCYATSWVDLMRPELGVQTERSIRRAAIKIWTTIYMIKRYEGRVYKNRYKINIAKVLTRSLLS